MNKLVNGEWRTDAYETTGEDGSFEREATAFRDEIRDEPDAEYQPETGRYHLYVSYACPWAHRTLLLRSLKGLEDAISVSVVDPFRDEDGWQFTPEKEGCTPDHLYDADYLRELYVKADPDATCRVTVPVLWDKQEEMIVNNESEEIIRILDVAFDDLATRDVGLYPEGYQDDVDRIINEIYEPINNGVYRAGFASEQEPYDEAIDDLFDALEHWNEVLADQRYLAGDRLTEADICMFTTLVRFDQVYHTTPTTWGKVSDSITELHHDRWQKIVDYANIYPYMRDLYQTNGVADTVHFDHIIEHYACPGSPPGFDPEPFPEQELHYRLQAPHNRDSLTQ